MKLKKSSRRDLSLWKSTTDFCWKKRRGAIIADNGNIVGAGETVTFTLNGVTSKVKTDSKGYATLRITDLTPNTYSVSAEYKGISVSNVIVVKQILKASNSKYKRFNAKKYTAFLAISHHDKLVPVSNKISFSYDRYAHEFTFIE